MNSAEFALADEHATEALGAHLGRILTSGAVIYLEGPLGAGKTTFVRGLLRALGHSGAVKSPTYTLVESYTTGELTIHHFDLYRLTDAEELEYMGIRDYFSLQSVCLIEWPSRGVGVLPQADLVVSLRVVAKQRAALMQARTTRGQTLLEKLNAA